MTAPTPDGPAARAAASRAAAGLPEHITDPDVLDQVVAALLLGHNDDAPPGKARRRTADRSAAAKPTKGLRHGSP
jgi:hypothetical protein